PFRRRDGFTLTDLPLRRDRDQFVGDIENPRLDPRLARLPTDAAELVELCRRVLAAVTRQHLDVLDRDIELIVAGVEQAQAIVRRAADVERFKPVIAPDAVIDMDDEIAGLKGGNLGDEIVVSRAPPHRTRKPLAQYVLFREERDPVGG